MAIFCLQITGVVTTPGTVRIETQSGLFEAEVDGPKPDQLETLKRDIAEKLNVPMHAVTFDVGIEEQTQEHLLWASRRARTNAEVLEPKPRSRFKPGPRTN